VRAPLFQPLNQTENRFPDRRLTQIRSAAQNLC
jgi:hypothetical protein